MQHVVRDGYGEASPTSPVSPPPPPLAMAPAWFPAPQGCRPRRPMTAAQHITHHPLPSSSSSPTTRDTAKFASSATSPVSRKPPHYAGSTHAATPTPAATTVSQAANIAQLNANNAGNSNNNTDEVRRMAAHWLRELRARTADLLEAQLALDSLQAELTRMKKRNAENAARVVRDYPALSSAQRALLDFDALLQPTLTRDEIRRHIARVHQGEGQQEANKKKTNDRDLRGDNEADATAVERVDEHAVLSEAAREWLEVMQARMQGTQDAWPTTTADPDRDGDDVSHISV